MVLYCLPDKQICILTQVHCFLRFFDNVYDQGKHNGSIFLINYIEISPVVSNKKIFFFNFLYRYKWKT